MEKLGYEQLVIKVFNETYNINLQRSSNLVDWIDESKGFAVQIKNGQADKNFVDEATEILPILTKQFEKPNLFFVYPRILNENEKELNSGEIGNFRIFLRALGVEEVFDLALILNINFLPYVNDLIKDNSEIEDLIATNKYQEFLNSFKEETKNTPQPTRKKQTKGTEDKLNVQRKRREKKSTRDTSEPLVISKELLTYNYYFARVPIRSLNQFVNENIWETEIGFSKYANLVQKGSILLGISPVFNNRGNEARFRIPLIGYVYKNDEDAKNLGVKWVRVPSLTYNPEEIADNTNLSLGQIGQRNLLLLFQKIYLTIKAPLEDVITELQKEADDLLEQKNNKEGTGDKAKEEKEELQENITRLAGIRSDADSGTDYLDIENDVKAFARVMCAKSFNPPLAIGLLGKWGSGKSFFMRRLQQEVELLTQKDKDIYCEGVAEVHFNAWSYMDANLWAGIVTKIFERLDLYIKNEKKSDREENKVKEEIAKKLSITSDAVIALTKKKDETHQKIETLETEKNKLDETIKEKNLEKEKISLTDHLKKFDDEFNLIQKIEAALKENKSYIKTVENLKAIVPEKYWKNPTEFYEQLKAKKLKNTVRQFFNKETWKKNWLLLVISIVVLFVGPILINKYTEIVSSAFFDKIWLAASTVTTVAIGLSRSSKKLASVFNSLTKIQKSYSEQASKVEEDFEQKKKQLEAEIENSKRELESLTTQKEEAEEKEEALKNRINKTLSSETLFQFIEKRAVTNEYEKHLGIVSVIRKDFEILSELFAKSETKRKSFTEKEVEDFKEQFDRPLERIILYVDDLDRCSEERVVEVLEAVNLLMAFPLFIVVVGVDPRWVKIALEAKYKKQFTSNTSEEGLKISPSNYLEKIFQIPFRLKSAEDQTVKSMLRSLAEQKAKTNKEVVKKVKSIDEDPDEGKKLASETDEKKLLNPPSQGEGKLNLPESIGTPATTPQSDQKEVVVDPKTADNNPPEKIESLEFSRTEIDLIQEMSPVLGSNPRAIKRFVNIYRVIKAHDIFNYNEQHQNQEILADLFLIALPFGHYRILVPSFMSFLNQGRNSSIKTYLNRGLKDEASEEEKKVHDIRKKLLKELDLYGPNVLKIKKQHFNAEHVEFIKRFYFN